jgi:hypothetical protein
MLRMVDEVSAEKGPAIRQMVREIIRSLPSPPNGEQDVSLTESIIHSAVEAFDRTVVHISADGSYNWGRVVTVFTFAGWFVVACLQDDGGIVDGKDNDAVSELTSSIGHVVAKRLSAWISSNGGWEEFERFFRRPPSTNLERLLWRGLKATIVELGTVAIGGVR